MRVKKKKKTKQNKKKDSYYKYSFYFSFSIGLIIRYNQRAVVTEETKLILHKLLIRFLKDVMINLVCLHRRKNANSISKKV